MSGLKAATGAHERPGAKDTRAERAKKQETLEKIAHLQTKAAALERERSNQLYSKRHEFRSSYSSLEEHEFKLSRQRINEKHELQQHIGRITSSVAAFRRMLADMKPGPAFVEKLKVVLEEIEASITAFKEKQRQIYEALLLEERTTAQEVAAFEKKLDSWLSAKQPPAPPTTATAAARTTATASSVPPAVAAFERFLQQTGGRQGGWDDYDHQTFLRVRSKKLPGEQSLVEAAVRELPTRSAAEVEWHEHWYTEYCTLLERKKRAIDDWKTAKQSSKVGAPNQQTDDEQPGDNTSKGPTQEEIFAKEREERFKKLSAWKAQQELKRMEEEEEKLKAKLSKAKEIEKEKKRQEALRERVGGYTLLKEERQLLAEQRRQQEQAEELERRRTATRELARFRERDLFATTEKRQLMQAKEAEKLEKEKKLEQLKEKVEAPRDPSRLYRLTAGWEERKKAGLDSAKVAHTTGRPPRRAVPSWRQGL